MKISYIQFLKALLPYAMLVPDLLALAEQILSAPTLADKWAAIKSLGDSLLPILGDMLDVKPISALDAKSEGAPASAAVELKPEELEAELSRAIATAHGEDFTACAFDGSRFKKLFEIIGPLLPVLIELLK